MKIAVIGTGKTGGTILQKLGKEGIGFNRSNPPAVDKIRQTDAAIVFVPGDAAGEVIDILLEAEILAVWGTTGYEWPDDLPEKVEKTGCPWVIGSNFSLGMNLVRKTLNLIGKGSAMLNDPEFSIHEIHHTEKIDAPSGTALSWKEWLGKEAAITSERIGDVKGIHELHMKTENESVYLKHEAHNRELFAEGAIWTVNYLLSQKDLNPGVYSFAEIFDRAYRELI